jgi:hypothetical protein
MLTAKRAGARRRIVWSEYTATDQSGLSWAEMALYTVFD